jgi:dTDP-4-dehydrorhamnose 3,5-epimerase
MTFTETRIPGAWIIDLKMIPDDRGFFAMTWLPGEFASRGLDSSLAQCNLAFNHKRGTLRGMHFQRAPHEQAKLVRCTRGSIHDVIVDLRPGSPTFQQWEAVELNEDNRRMLYIPGGLAHGYITLTDGAEVFYQASSPWEPKAEGGVRWDDPAFGIKWPSEPSVISERDAGWPLRSDDAV